MFYFLGYCTHVTTNNHTYVSNLNRVCGLERSTDAIWSSARVLTVESKVKKNETLTITTSQGAFFSIRSSNAQPKLSCSLLLLLSSMIYHVLWTFQFSNQTSKEASKWNKGYDLPTPENGRRSTETAELNSSGVDTGGRVHRALETCRFTCGALRLRSSLIPAEVRCIRGNACL